VRLLTVNAGSTSLKLAVVDRGVATTHPRSLDDALAQPPPDGVAHRVVHGGDHDRAVIIDDAVLAELGALGELAPMHQPPALDGIDRCRSAWPDVPNVACFDTAFHTTIPEAARTYALPARFRRTVRSYGFHGLSHAWAAARVAEHAPDADRLLIAHLGGGQSLCAVRDGRSIMTTMGFTPLDGLVMATRPGSLDPGAVAWLAQHHPDLDVAGMLERESGLLGLCGTAHMREVHQRADSGDPEAAMALAVWRHRAVTLAGACVTALGGLDALAFTGGIGEHDAVARQAIVAGLGWLGVAAEDRGETPDDLLDITAPGSTARVIVVRAREDLRLAAEAEPLLRTA
jgi:acetate kinase